MKLTLKELEILVLELRVASPGVNDNLTDKQQERLTDFYERLVDKLADEIKRRKQKSLKKKSKRDNPYSTPKEKV